MNNMKKKRIIYFDIMNIFACIAVITLHHNGIVHSFKNTIAWKESLVAECVFYWAVPVFLMISGANLLNYREKYSTKDFFKKRIVRTVIPWIAWSIIMLFWKLNTGQIELEEKSLGYIVELIANYKVESVYWFFGALFACYLAIPVFSALVKERKILWYVVALNFIFLSCLPALKTWFDFQWGLSVPVTGSLIIYVLLGYLIETSKLNRCKRILIYILGLSGLLFRFVYTYINSMKTQVTDTSIKGYVMFHAVFLSVAVFVWLKNVRWEKWLPEWLIKILPQISSCSFGVYLIHKIVMYYERNIFELSTESHIWRIAFIPVTYLVSLGIIFILKKIPVIKNIAG